MRAVALLVVVAGALGAQPRQGGPQPTKATFVTTVEGVTEYSLPNGLRVLLVPDSTRPSVTVNVVYFVGSRNEGNGEAGMAHLLEHLLFLGSKNHPRMFAEQTIRGSRRSGGTSSDNTYYLETISAVDSLIDWALDLQADRMVNAFVSRKSLETEFSVVRNELELNDSDPSTVARDRLKAAAFRFHPYGRPTIGTVSDIENVPIERLQAFYRRYYQPDNAMLVVAGRFSPQRMLARVEQKFGSIPRPKRSAALGNQLARAYTVEPPQDGDQYVTVRRTTDEQILMLGYHATGVGHPDYAPLEVLADVLGSNPSGRLYKALVDTRQATFLIGDVYSSEDPNLLFVRARLRRDQSLDSVYARMVRLMDSARVAQFTAEEVGRAQRSLLRNMQLLMGNAELFPLVLADWAGAGDWRLAFLHRDRLAGVTPQDVQRVAAMYLKPSNRTAVVVIPTDQPDRTVVPASPNVAQLVAGYKGGAVIETGETLDPSPRSLEQRITRTTLPSGMRLSLLPKRSRGGKVIATLVLRGGTEQSLQGKALVATLTAGMLMRGTSALTRQQLIDSLSKLTAAVTASAAANTVTVTIETIRANLIPVLALVADVVKTPALDAEELERYKKERLGALDNQKSEPIQQAYIAATRNIAPRPVGHILRALTTDELMQGVVATTIDDVRAYHRENYGGSAADFAAVGDFDVAQLRGALQRHFGDWRNTSPVARIARTYTPTDSAFVTIEIPDKPNAAFGAAMAFALKDDDPDYPAMALANYMISGAGTSILMTRLREREGLTYGVTAFFIPQPFDRLSTWSSVIIVAPKNMEQLQRSFRDELDRIVSKGFTADEFQIYRDGYLQGRLQSRGTESELVSMLVNRSYAGRTLGYDAALDAAIASLTLDQLNATVKKYFDPRRLALARAGDFKNNPPAPSVP